MDRGGSAPSTRSANRHHLIVVAGTVVVVVVHHYLIQFNGRLAPDWRDIAGEFELCRTKREAAIRKKDG